MDNFNVLNSNFNFQNKQAQLLQKKKLEESCLQSVNTSLGLMFESEKVGASTAEELLHQREQLNKIDSNLDTITSGLKQSQKHINSMSGFFKSIFKPIWKNDKQLQNESNLPSSQSANNFRETNQLSNCVNKLRSNSTQYTSNKTPFQEDLFENDNNEQLLKQKDKTGDFDELMESKLSDLQSGLSRLKDLASNLGNEIEEQNEKLDTIIGKSDKVEDTIKFQNKQIRKHLGK